MKPWELLSEGHSVQLTLTRPPSANRLFKNIPGRGRARTAEYDAWIELNLFKIKNQKPKCVRGTYHLAISCQRSNKRADLDNILKATNDILKKAGVIQEDNLCESLEAAWTYAGSTTGDSSDTMYVRVTAHKGE